jgi:Ca-activated chloride channel family protein
MKKFLQITSIILSLILLLSFVSCNSAGEAEDGYFAPGANYAPDGNSGDFSYSMSGILTGNVSAELDGNFSADEEAEEEPADSPSYETPDKAPSTETTTPQQPAVSFVENPFINTSNNNVSTFSADVDTASYTYFRKLINQGYTLEHLRNGGNAFRTEEFINYFRYDCPTPEDGKLFGVRTDIVACPWSSDSHLLRITLQAETATPTAGNNLVFLIDVSGSMSSKDKLPLLKKAFSYLVGSLGENDKVSIVTYSGKEEIVLDGCAGNADEMIMTAINSLVAGGATNGQAGLTEAYRIAEKHFIEGGNNRIIMASDGDLNVGISSAEELTRFIEQKRDQGVYLSVLGFGTGNYRDSNMEALADNGNGVYYYIDGETEAEKVLGTDILSTLYTVAEDVKLQIEFSPEYISSYRLIGYENRLLNKEDFEDDTKDAGEVGASHQVTVCYEIKLKANPISSLIPNLLTLRIRYKNPGESLSLLNEYTYGEETVRVGNEISDDIKFICALIETSMILHNSEYAKNITIDDVLETLESLDIDSSFEKNEFRELIRKLAQ